MIFAMQHGMVWVGNAEMPYNEEGINRLGSFTGLMAQAGQVAPDVESNIADRKSAERLGQRIASATTRWAMRPLRGGSCAIEIVMTKNAGGSVNLEAEPGVPACPTSSSI